MIKTSFVVIISLSLNIQLFAQNLDINLLKNINQNRNQNFDKPFENLSKSVYPIGLAVPIGLLGVGIIQKDKSLQRQGVVALASLTMAFGTTYTLKRIIKRERPAITYPFIHPAIIEADPSFPSGHTTSAFASATSLSLAYRKWYVVVPAFTWASSVAYARLHLGVHYPSDVLAGAVVGAGSAWLCYKANRWLQKTGTKTQRKEGTEK